MTGGGFTVSDSDGSVAGRFSGQSYIRGPSWLNLPTLTICFLGVQISWSVEMSNASPYLLSLGLSKSAMAVVFVAGPLSGLIVQPLIGVLADNNTSKWGRRRPYMMLGTVICAVALLVLGWTKVVAGWFVKDSSSLVIILAVLSIYVIDFSINAGQAMDRALLVDVLPSALQPAGNAWAAKMLAIGNVVGFFIGKLDLPQTFPLLGSTQLQVLSLISSLVLLVTHLTTAVMVRERVLVDKPQFAAIGPIQKFIQELKDIWINMLTLPRVIRQICIIQLFAWLGWFPLLVYTSVYVGDLNKRAFYATAMATSPATEITPETLSSLDTESTRLGSRALFYSSLITLFVNFALPYFVTNSSRQKQRRHQQTAENGFGSSQNLDGTHGGSGMNGHAPGRSPNLLRGFAIPDKMQMDLSTLWTVSHAVFALCMLGTFFTTSVAGASTLVTITGFSWAFTQWVPFALLGEAILTEPSALTEDGASIQLTETGGNISLAIESRRELSMVGPRARENGRAGAAFTIHDELSGLDSDEGDDEESEREKNDIQKQSTLLGDPSEARVSKVDGGLGSEEQYPQDDDDDEGEDAVLVGRVRRPGDEEGVVEDLSGPGALSTKAGIILGIHNIFIVVPQFIVTGISTVVFAIFDPSKNTRHPGASNRTGAGTGNNTDIAIRLLDASDQEVILEELADSAKSNSVVYLFRFGGVAAFVAFILCWRLSRELRHR